LERSGYFYLMIIAVPFFMTVVLTPLISKFAINKAILDKPGAHKIHSKAKPLLGGVAIFVVFTFMLLFFFPTDDKLTTLVLATLVLVITGLIDDIYDLKPLIKLSGQTIAAAIVVLGNIHLYVVLLNYFNRFSIPDFVVLFFIIGWIVLMINAFNLIDGLDGLAVGTAAIIFLSMAILSVIEGGRANILGVQLIDLGACLGFLRYNFYPAKIFMGDTGSMLLGFILATTHLYTIKYPFSAQLVLGSMFIFAYPALDVAYTFYRRICNRCSIFHADRGHIHHVLLSLGFSVRKTVLIIYAVNFLFAALAIVLLSLQISPRLLLFLWIATFCGVTALFIYLLKLSEQKGLNN
jgi:UDP-GlcNAc:undecaprenyl-phosphate/decaprenyl-phosphate GlcNAc-1-phosphate transferase